MTKLERKKSHIDNFWVSPHETPTLSFCYVSSILLSGKIKKGFKTSHF